MIKKINNRLAHSVYRGFTIVELIVVISVIGILASIVMVSYIGTQKKATMSSYNATAQQVKLKLGDYYTDNNKMPSTKGVSAATADSILKYLNDTNSATLGTAFTATYNGSTAIFNYYPCRTGVNPCNASTTGCDNAAEATACTQYAIIVSKAAWSGGSSDADIVVTGP
ncbi:prepilin-type N-terminal cleavage/methylation domain-containing protein [Candidatus Saccharibacteria bacterium]|nr:prepilin-type N-terminal cleavage/methylation domain-containing protein [Candidatus Saccharibacteria bacterium]